MAGDIQTTSGAKFYISGAAVTSAVDTLAEFEAISGWTEVQLVENLGELGDESAEVTGTAISDGRVRKAKGARNAGTMAVVCFRDPNDTGQEAVRVAEATKFNYGFKVVLEDAITEAYSNTVRYFRGLVMSQREQYNTADDIMRRTFNIGVNSAVIEDPSTI